MLFGCGDDGRGNSGSATASDSAASVTIGTLSTSGPTSGMTEGSTTESGSGSVSASSDPTTTGSSTDAVTGSTTGTTGAPPGSCGDGQIDAGEECDDGPANGPGEACNDDCTANTCGDSVQGPGEDCDLGPMNGTDNGCSIDCKLEASSCGNQVVEAELIPKPVDIILTIDNSGSMGEEILGVQNNINNNFAQIIEASGLDYRVILVSRFGNLGGESVCIEAPLGGIPQGGCANPPGQPVNGQRFFHYSVEIGSHNSWCHLLNSYDGGLADEFGFAPTGWREWLRADAFKVFLELTDDGVDCTLDGTLYDDNNSVAGGMAAATAFDNNLRATDPAAFGDAPDNRNYKWYSIVGMAYNNPPEQPYTPLEPVITGECPSAADNGTGYQTLSNMTDGLRFPLCDTTKYDVVFQAIAEGVVADAQIACDFEIPDPPPDKTLDEDSIVVLFTPAGQMNPIILMQVPSPDQCDPMSFYVENGKVFLCPEACDLAQDDPDPKLEVEFKCEPLMPN
jgi:hypothetical protein